MKIIIKLLIWSCLVSSIKAASKGSTKYVDNCVSFLKALPDMELSFKVNPNKENIAEEEKQFAIKRSFKFVKKGESYRFDVYTAKFKKLKRTFSYHAGNYYVYVYDTKTLITGSKLSDFKHNVSSNLGQFPTAQKMYLTTFCENISTEKNGAIVGYSSDQRTMSRLTPSKNVKTFKKMFWPDYLDLNHFYKVDDESYTQTVLSKRISIIDIKVLEKDKFNDSYFMLSPIDCVRIQDMDLKATLTP